MKIKFSFIFYLIIIFIFFSCLSQAENLFIPVPDEKYFIYEDSAGINLLDIVQTKEGGYAVPDWLYIFINSGMEALESYYRFYEKYVFIVTNEGENFNALSRWADNYSEALDFPMLAAARIERKMIKSASLYPDDEYGRFFEKLVKGAYNADFPGAVKEETFWIQIKINNDDNNESSDASVSENYIFFVLISIDKPLMQDVINNLIAQASESAAATRAQAAAITGIKQNFFMDF